MKKPEVRIKGFSAEWETKKLVEEADSIDTGKSKFVVKDFGRYEILGSRSVLGYDDDFDYEGDFLLTARVGANAGELYRHSGRVKISDNTVFIKGNQIDFLYQVLNNIGLKTLAFGTGQPLIKASELKTLSIVVPSDIHERNELSCLFKSIDALIKQNQSEVDRLRNLKKAMLLKMFPQKGSKVPEIRFKGFSGDWETKPFKSIAARVTDFDSDARLPHVEYEDLNTGEGTLNKDLSKKECNKKGLVFDKGDVLYGKLRPYLHNWLLPTFKGIAVGDFWVLRPVETDAGFLYCLIRTADYDTVANQSSGTKMPRADWKLVSATEFQIPKSIDEQHLIGQYFQDLDSLIEQRQSNTDRLRHLKQAMLQRMFV